ncbi:MAG: GPW/gp25 family protein [Myxococcota bacterium]
MSRVLGRGVRFPFRPDVTGGFSLVGGDEGVAQSIELILATALGERQMRFTFGSDLPNMIFEPVNGATLARIEDAARAAVVEQEPRVRLEAVSAEADPNVESKVVLTLEFIVLSTSRRSNLVFPFYLEER